MRKIFVAAIAFIGFALVPAAAEARPFAPPGSAAVFVDRAPARTHIVRGDLTRTRLITQRIEGTLRQHTRTLNRAQRMRLISRPEVRTLQREIQAIRSDLRRSVGFNGILGRAQERRLEARVATLDRRVAFVTQSRRGLALGPRRF